MIRVASCFAQVLELIDRGGFGQVVRELKAERGAKGFRCWDQFVAMLFCQLGAVSPHEGGHQAAPAVAGPGMPALLGVGDRGAHA